MKKKSGSIAIPFLITMLVTMLLVGGAALWFYLDHTKEDTVLKQLNPNGTLITEADKKTILCVLDTSDDGAEPMYALIRFNPIQKKTVCVAIPNNALLDVNGKSVTADIAYANGGVSALKKAVASELEITIDYYLMFESTGFERFYEILGGAEVTVPTEIEGLPAPNTLQYLNGAQFFDLMTYDYHGDEMQRSIINSFLMAQLLNQAENSRILETMDSTVVTMLELSTTDISALEYQKHEHAVKFVLQFAPISAVSIVPSMDQMSEGYVLSESCQKRFRTASARRPLI